MAMSPQDWERLLVHNKVQTDSDYLVLETNQVLRTLSSRYNSGLHLVCYRYRYTASSGSRGILERP